MLTILYNNIHVIVFQFRKLFLLKKTNNHIVILSFKLFIVVEFKLASYVVKD